MSLKSPTPGATYSYREICETLMLRDTPCLSFFDEDGRQVIQDSHMTEEEMLEVPGFAESKWVYERETHEWIPIFRYAKDNTGSIMEIIDKVDKTNCQEHECVYFLPKGTDRQF